MVKARKILLIEPGHVTSTIETFRGFADGFLSLGCDVWEYSLGERISFFRKANKAVNPEGKVNETQLLEAATESIIVAALDQKVDLILYITAQFIPHRTFQMVREGLKIPQGIIFTESPYLSNLELDRLKSCDFAFTNDESCLEPYRKVNKNVFFLPQGYRQDVFEANIASSSWYESDIFFVGTIFPRRQIFLNKICENFFYEKIKFYGTPLKPVWESDQFKRAFARRTLPQEEYAKFLKKTKIALCPMREYRIAPNAHIVPMNPGPRFFEILATGAFCITEWREGLKQYGPERNFVTYKSTEECIDKIEFYLKHKEEREKIAVRGRKRVFEKESFLCRAKTALKIIEKLNPC